MTNVLNRAHRLIGRAVLSHPRLAVGCVIVLTLGLAVAGLPPKVEGKLSRMLPEDNPEVVALNEWHSAPGGQGAVFLTFGPDDDLRSIAERLKLMPSVRHVFHAFDEELEFRLGLLQLESWQIDALTTALESALSRSDPGAISDFPQLTAPRLFPPDRIIVYPEGELNSATSLKLVEELEATVPEAIWMAGPHVTIVNTVREIKEDIAKTSLVALVLVILVASLLLRDWRATLLLFPPLILSVVSTMAITQLIIGSINTFTSFASAVLLGLGIDIGIHLMARFREERVSQPDPRAAVELAWERSGPPCTIATFTSAATFFLLLVADFKGFSQLGLILGIGIILCWIYMLVLLPVLLVYLDPPPMKTPGKMHSHRPNPVIIGVALVLTGALIFLLPDLEFEYDYSELRKDGLAWKELDSNQRRYREQAFPPAVVRSKDTQLDAQRLSQMINNGYLSHVAGVFSILDLIPNDQAERWGKIKNLAELAGTVDAQQLPESVRPELVRLASIKLGSITIDELPPAVALMLGSEMNSPPIYLRLQGNMQDFRVATSFADEVETAAQGLKVSSEFLVQAVLFESIQADMPRIAVLTMSAVIIIMLICLRSLRGVLVALAAMSMGLIWAWAGLVFLGVKINIVNIVVIPVIFGIGVDVAIHMIYRLQGNSSPGEVLSNTGLAALASTATTVAAFSALLWAGNRGVKSVGELVVVGLTLVFLASIITTVSLSRRKSTR